MHLCDDYKEFGPLYQCSAFPFENYMGYLKKMLRKPHKPLEQIIKRYSEVCSLKSQMISKKHPFLTGLHNRGPTLLNKGKQFTSIIFKNMILKTHIEADSYFITHEKIIVKIINIIQKENSEDIVLICKQFEKNINYLLNP